MREGTFREPKVPSDRRDEDPIGEYWLATIRAVMVSNPPRQNGDRERTQRQSSDNVRDFENSPVVSNQRVIQSSGDEMALV